MSYANEHLANYHGAKGAYSLSDAPEVLLPWVERLRNENVSLILWEPCFLMDPDKRSDFADMLAEVDIVSPDLDGAAGLCGLDSPTALKRPTMNRIQVIAPFY